MNDWQILQHPCLCSTFVFMKTFRRGFSIDTFDDRRVTKYLQRPFPAGSSPHPPWLQMAPISTALICHVSMEKLQKHGVSSVFLDVSFRFFWVIPAENVLQFCPSGCPRIVGLTASYVTLEQNWVYRKKTVQSIIIRSR